MGLKVKTVPLMFKVRSQD